MNSINWTNYRSDFGVMPSLYEPNGLVRDEMNSINWTNYRSDFGVMPSLYEPNGLVRSHC